MPPAAPGLPLLRNTLDLVRDPLSFFARMYQELGPVFRVGGPGRDYVVLAGPKANRQFLEWEEEHVTSGPVYQPYVDDLGSRHVLIAMDGEPHRIYRRWLRPGFSREAITPHVSHMVESVEAYIAAWKPGDTLNVTEVMQYLIAQLGGMALAGCPIDHHFDDARVFAHTFLGAGVGSFPGFMRMLPRYRQSRRRFFEFLRSVVANHRGQKSNGRSLDLIDLLLHSEPPFGIPLTESDILASAHMPYTNSLVYVAATCGFILYELLKNPDIMEQVRVEIDLLFADGAPSLSMLRQTKWLRGALLETQRLHPIALSLPRYVHHSFEFEGYLIEAGSMTLTATAVTHFLPEFFPDPHRFDASRYWAPRREQHQPGMLVPFGLGPHVCLSAGVVNAFVLLCIGTLLRHVEFALLPSDYELGISVAPFPAPARDFKLRIAKRRSVGRTGAQPSQAFPFELEEILPELDSDSLIRAVSRAEKRSFAPADVIIREGDRADAFYIVSSGEVEVIREGLTDEPKIVARLGVGEYFGEIGLLQAVPRTASVRAFTSVECIVLSREAFIALVAETDLTSGEIAAVMQRRLISTMLATTLPRLTPDQVSEIAPEFEMNSFEPGEVIIHQGEPADDFYIIVRGQVEVINRHPDGRDIHLGSLGEGEYFGEIGLLQGRPRNATVRAASRPVRVMTLGRDQFLALMSDSTATSSQVAMRMAERLSEVITASLGPR